MVDESYHFFVSEVETLRTTVSTTRVARDGRLGGSGVTRTGVGGRAGRRGGGGRGYLCNGSRRWGTRGVTAQPPCAATQLRICADVRTGPSKIAKKGGGAGREEGRPHALGEVPLDVSHSCLAYKKIPDSRRRGVWRDAKETKRPARPRSVGLPILVVALALILTRLQQRDTDRSVLSGSGR